jgi:uncharacterized protein
MSLTKLVSAVVGDKRRWRAYRARVERLPERYRSAVAAIQRYLLHFVPVDGNRAVTMFEDLADLFERASLEGTSIRDIVGSDPIEFLELFARNYTTGGFVPDDERARVRRALTPEDEGASSSPEKERRPSRLVKCLIADRHSLPLSIALHLIPGVLIVAAYALLAEPFVKAIRYPIFLAWVIALVLVLGPLQVCLLWLGHAANGRRSMRGVVRYLDHPLSRGKAIATIAGLIVWMTTVSLALTPLDNLVFTEFFTWIPFEGAGGSATTYLNGYSHSTVLITMIICLPLTGFSLPLIEELYFRGFLLPRISHLRWGAPVLNTLLFSVYHFWAPWTVLSKIVFMFPAVWLVWRKRDIRLSIGMHVGTTLLMSTAGILAVILGAIP